MARAKPLPLPNRESLRAEGSLALRISDFVFLDGTFAFEKSTVPLRVTGESQNRPLEALLIGASNVQGFAGINGPGTRTDGSVNTDGEIGLTISEGLFRVGFVKSSGHACDGE